jgi:hypothetical protein
VDAGNPDAGPLEIIATVPLSTATGVWVSPLISATFNQPLDSATLSPSTFTLVQDVDGGVVPGLVSSDAGSSTAIFIPTAPLGAGQLYTATITTSAHGASQVTLAAAYSWSFTTTICGTDGGATPVNLGAAANYVILAQTGISTASPSTITGNIAVSPATATAITGFSLTLDASGTFATSTQVTGDVYGAGYDSPTPSDLTTAINNMDTAFTNAAGQPACVTELGAGNIGGMTLAPGVYKWGTAVLIPSNVYLNGSATDVWIFEIAQDLTLSSGVSVFLEGGAVAQNVLWQVSGQTTLGTTAHLEGTVLCQTAIILDTGASINGRLLAQTAVTLDTSKVMQP